MLMPFFIIIIRIIQNYNLGLSLGDTNYSYLRASSTPTRFKKQPVKKVVLPYQKILMEKKKDLKMLKFQEQLQLEEASSQSSDICFPRFLSPVELVRMLQLQSLPINRNLTTSALNVDKDKIKAPLSPLSYWSHTKSSESRMELSKSGPLPSMKSTMNTLRSLPNMYNPSDSTSIQPKSRSQNQHGKYDPTASIGMESSYSKCSSKRGCSPISSGRRRGYSPVTSRMTDSESELDSLMSVYDQLLPVSERIENESARMVMLICPPHRADVTNVILEDSSPFVRQPVGKIKIIPNYSMRAPLSNNSEFVRVNSKHRKKGYNSEDGLR